MIQPITITPEEIEQRVREGQEIRKSEADARLRLKQVGANLVKEHGLSILHMPYAPEMDTGGYTVAYRPTMPGGRVFDVAVAVQNPKDQYVRDSGRALAAIRFAEGQTIQMRLPKNYVGHPKSFFQSMFGGPIF